MKTAYILLVFIAGIFAGFLVGYYAVVIFLVLLITTLLVDRFAKSGKRIPAQTDLINNLTVALIFLTVGATVAKVSCRSIRSLNEFDEYDVVGTVISHKILTSGDLYTLQISSINEEDCEGDVSVLTSHSTNFSNNDILRFRSRLEDESVCRFSRQRLRAKVFGEDNAPVKIGEDRSVSAIFRSFSEKIATIIDKSALSKQSRALLIALIVADRSSLSHDEITKFRDAGVIHILAVSGMHIGILFGLLLIITRPMVLISRKSRFIVITIAVWIFVLFTGCNLSTVRAAMMLTLANFGLIIDRRRTPFDITCLALLFILFISPDALFDMGLQLSFASVAAITLLTDRLNPINKIKSKRTYNIYSAILATLVATATTWVITGYYFGEVSLRFLPANLLILPLLPAYMILGIFYVLLISIGMESSLVVFFLDLFPKVIYATLDFISPHSSAVSVTTISLICWLAAIPLLAKALPKRPSYEYNISDDTPNIIVRKNWLCASLLMILLSLTAITLNI